MDSEKESKTPNAVGTSGGGAGRKLLRSCNHCKSRKTKCSGYPAPCDGCIRRKLQCRFSQANIPRRANANTDLIVNTTPYPNGDTEPVPRPAKPVPELFVDRLLAQVRSPDLLKYDRPYAVKNGLFAGNYSLMFFSDNRLQQLTKRLNNDKVKVLLQRISSVISLRVGHTDKLSSSSIKRVATTRNMASRDSKASAYWIKSYFDLVHPFYPFLDRQHFESIVFGPLFPRLLAENKAWSALYYAVLALGCQATSGGSFEPGKGEAWQMFSTSLSILPDLMILPDSLTMLQAMAAMTIYSLGISCLAIEHFMISEAARRAQSLGNAKLTGNALLCYQKVFWVLYFVEKVSSFHFGRNSVFCDHDIVFPVPAVPEAIFEGFDWFLTSVKYSRLLSRAATSLFSAGVLGNPKTYYLAAIDQLEGELEKLRLSIPESVRPWNKSGRQLTHLSRVMRTVAIWISYFHHSLRLNLCRATLHLHLHAKDAVTSARQGSAIRIMMETARQILELAAYVDVEPYTPLWVIGGIPLTSYFVLFDFVINNPKSPETMANLALLDIAGGHFSRIEYASGGSLPGSLLSGFAHIAREYVHTISLEEVSGPKNMTMATSNNADKTVVPLSATSTVTGNHSDTYLDTSRNYPSCSSQADTDMAIGTYSMDDEFPFMDVLNFPVTNISFLVDGTVGAGTDVMGLFNTHIPGIDPGFFNQPVEDYFTQPLWD